MGVFGCTNVGGRGCDVGSFTVLVTGHTPARLLPGTEAYFAQVFDPSRLYRRLLASERMSSEA
jgi:hypothetical protein